MPPRPPKPAASLDGLAPARRVAAPTVVAGPGRRPSSFPPAPARPARPAPAPAAPATPPAARTPHGQPPPAPAPARKRPAKPAPPSIPSRNRAEPKPEPKPADSDVATGLPFVRMLNNAGCVCPVPESVVGDKLCDGYKFIEGEPTIPRTIDPEPDLCDAQRDGRPWRAVPRNHVRPAKTLDALTVWQSCVIEDIHAFAGHPHLDKQFLVRLTNMIARLSLGSGAVNVSSL